MRKKTPIIVGGTGFYIDAALDRINIASVPSDPKLRARLEKKSADVLFQTLKGLDPARVKTIDLKNKRRLIRAIEVAKSKKRKKQRDQLVAYMQPVDLDILWLGIKTKPEELREKINKRLAKRLKTGMIAEIKKLHANPPAGGGVSWKRLDSLGLEPKWISKYLRGEITKEEMIKKLQTEIWRYSRRQITWFRRNKKIRWVSLKENLSKLF